MSKYFNPLSEPTEEKAVQSESSTDQMLSTSAFQVTTANVCPKCQRTTMPSTLMDGEPVMYCRSCRVVLALPE